MSNYFYDNEKKFVYGGMKGVLNTQGECFAAEYSTLNKVFLKDKVNFEDERFLIQFDGVLLNDVELFEQYNSKSLETLLIMLWVDKNVEIVKCLKGAFVLLLWDKRKDIVLLTNDLLGKRDLYYYKADNVVYYAESFFALVSMLKDNEIELHIDIDACKHMINYGYLCLNETYICGVYRLGTYQSIVIDSEKHITIDTGQENVIDKKCVNVKELEDTFDIVFSQAVMQQYRKNDLNKYMQVASLSGGMDSRACLLEAKKLGYDVDLCFSYSQRNSVDDIISSQIAKDANLELLYFQLNNGVSVRYMYDAMSKNECQQSGIGSTGAILVSNMLLNKNIGIIHTGLLGGELLGDLITFKGSKFKYWVKRLGLGKWNDADCEYSAKKLMIHIRACQNFTHMFLKYCEVFSPFLDEDVVQFVNGIPSKYLIRRSFYRKWMDDYLPNKYFTTFFSGPIDISPMSEVFAKVIKYVKSKVFHMQNSGMNPFDLWYDNNDELRNNTNAEFDENLGWLKKQSEYSDLDIDINRAWKRNCASKYYVLTCLYALRKIIDD